MDLKTIKQDRKKAAKKQAKDKALLAADIAAANKDFFTNFFKRLHNEQ
jgi:hypothetical protein